jgi:hypothetical protein
VCRSGRGAPPTAHADARGRETQSPTAHNHGSRPDPLAGILHSRPKIRSPQRRQCQTVAAGKPSLGGQSAVRPEAWPPGLGMMRFRCAPTFFQLADMDFSVRRTGRIQISDHARVVLSNQHLVAQDFRGLELLQFSADGMRLERCAFDGSVIRSGSFGAGRATSEYVGCSFNDAKIHMGPGGYARFVDCTFENVAIDSWLCLAVELIRCSFSGQLHKAVFNGCVPPEKRDVAGRTTNRFEGNDFSRAKLLDVAFRTGIDLSKQRLPSGPEYTYLEDAPSAVRQARSTFNAWGDPDEKKRARGALAVMEEDVAAGQRQLLIRVNDYPRASRPSIQRLLYAALNE